MVEAIVCLGLGLDSNWNSFEIHSIRKFAIRWFERAKIIWKIRWKLVPIRFVWFNSNYRLESNFQKFDLFDSIRKFAIRLIWKVKKYSKNYIKINSKFVRYDLTPPLSRTLEWRSIFFKKSLNDPTSVVAFQILGNS